MENRNLHWGIDLVAIDTSGLEQYKKAIYAYRARDTQYISEVFRAMDSSLTKEKVVNSSLVKYEAITMGEEYTSIYYGLGYQYAKNHINSKFYRDERRFYSDAQAFQYEFSMFTFYLNATDKDLWFFLPIYCLPEVLISEEKLLELYDKSKILELQLTTEPKMAELQGWRQISKGDIKRYFLQKKQEGELGKFMQNYFTKCLENNFIIAIRGSRF